MTIAFNVINDTQLSYSLIFFGIFIGFLTLYLIHKQKSGTLFWGISALSNSIGFLLWSGTLFSLNPYVYIAGEIFHITGFFLLVYGAVAFVKVNIKKGVIVSFVVVWIILWLASISMIGTSQLAAVIALKALRSLLFIIGGILLILKTDDDEPVGKNIAGVTLVIWAAFIAASAVIKMEIIVFYSILVGLHVMAYFGMVIMITDGIRMEIDKKDRLVKKLEGILPICSYCKKIRGDNDKWIRIEEYIEERSKAEFSHGICPECFSQHKPDR